MQQTAQALLLPFGQCETKRPFAVLFVAATALLPDVLLEFATRRPAWLQVTSYRASSQAADTIGCPWTPMTRNWCYRARSCRRRRPPRDNMSSKRRTPPAQWAAGACPFGSRCTPSQRISLTTVRLQLRRPLLVVSTSSASSQVVRPHAAGGRSLASDELRHRATQYYIALSTLHRSAMSGYGGGGGLKGVQHFHGRQGDHGQDGSGGGAGLRHMQRSAAAAGGAREAADAGAGSAAALEGDTGLLPAELLVPIAGSIGWCSCFGPT